MAIWNPFTPGYFDNPYPHLKDCRTNNPVQKGVHAHWLLFKHTHIKHVLKSEGFNATDLSSYLASKEQLILGNTQCPFLAKGTRKWLMYLNGAEHFFTSEYTDALLRKIPITNLIKNAVEEVLDKTGKPASIDLAGIAAQIPYIVSKKIIGFDENISFEKLNHFSHQLAVSQDLYLSKNDYRKINTEFEWAFSIFEDMIKPKRPQQQVTLCNIIAQNKNTDDNIWTDDEYKSLLCILFMASFETTKDSLSSILFELIKNRDLLSYIVTASEKQINILTEELLRIASPLQYTVRVSKSDIEIDGHFFAAGTKLFLALASGNMDEEVFINADAIVPDRAYNPHLSFGGGLHSCIGARIARQEIRTWLKPLAGFLLNYQIRKNEQPVWQRTIFMRGLKQLTLDRI